MVRSRDRPNPDRLHPVDRAIPSSTTWRKRTKDTAKKTGEVTVAGAEKTGEGPPPVVVVYSPSSRTLSRPLCR